MTVKEIADRLIALSKTGEFDKAQKELYGSDVVSIEPQESPGWAKETKGTGPVYDKIKKFMGMIEETHAIEISEPLIATNSFAIYMRMDVTMKGQGRMDMKELAVYEVKDGKVVKEEFYM